MKFFDDIISYYGPFLGTFRTIAGYKTTDFMGASILSAITLETLAAFLQLNFLGVTVGMLVTVGFFIIMDWWTGSAASHHKALIYFEKGDMIKYELHRIRSRKVSFTIFKFISLYLWLVLSHSVYGIAVDNGFVTEGSATVQAAGLHTVLRVFSIVPIILFGFREFISIGENIKGVYGKAPYLFVLGEKIFETLQFNFLSRIKTETITPEKGEDLPVN